jgi:metallo-beta-lactamase family protein
VTRITAQHLELFDEEATRLSREAHPPGHLPTLRFTESVADSMALNRLGGGALILAASGMCDGGRIRHHLRHHLPNPRTTVIMIGFQAAGTLGRRLVDGAESVRIFGEEIPVRARVATLGGFSAHADQSALLAWLQRLRTAPRQLFLVHGEEAVATAFAARIEERLGWHAHIPMHGETAAL